MAENDEKKTAPAPEPKPEPKPEPAKPPVDPLEPDTPPKGWDPDDWATIKEATRRGIKWAHMPAEYKRNNPRKNPRRPK